MTKIEASIGRVHGDRYLPISNALEDFVGHPPRVENLQGWAGPNDLLQIIMDWESWRTFATLGAGIFGAAAVGKLGQSIAGDSYDALKRLVSRASPSEAKSTDSEKFERLERAIKDAIADGYAVTLSIPTGGQFRNNLGIELTSGDLAQILDASAILGEIGQDLRHAIESEEQSGQKVYGAAHGNRDGGPKIERLKDGSLAIRLGLEKDGQSVPLTIQYDRNGKRIKQLPPT
ncbi:hypothetical protein [Bradyrhizobium sp. WSM471]|uniref:hypothetical protein n=1 Tax=Bradyrhizobium sp. WSM471 TaxID=319017 RepID=UPI00024D2B62|nr:MULTISPECIES: hypothetical protein [Bradyrhizobium]EHR03675.1 hypothetical protein Bra471DRAFT_04460 [Bradyrhizobium sp. WSM471]UFW38866.1 hypothetical protein BcanWSM471_21830 [Bradyrhizobium canariense]